MSESKELTVPERAAIAVGAAEHEKHLVTLAKKYSDITKIANVAGRDQVHAGYMELKNARVAIEKAGKDAREDANAFQKAVIEEVKRLTAITTDEETRLQALRDEYDAEREREKAAKAAAEKARVDGIRNRIDEIKTCPAECVGRSAAEIQGAIDTMTAHEITLEEFAEFAGEAEMAKLAALAKLQEALAAQQAHEAEQARIAAEREALERQRAELAEQERVAALARAEQEAKDRAERERVEAEQRAAQERAAEAMRQQQAEHEARMAAQQAEIDRQQAEIAAARAEQERIERERQAAIEAEEQRKRDEAEAAARKAERERIERERAESLSARYATEPTGGTWSIGKTWGAIVSTAEIAGSPGSGHNDVEYYGGNLICESVWRPADARVLAASRDMFDALRQWQHAERVGDQEELTNARIARDAAIEKAIYVPEVQPEAQAA